VAALLGGAIGLERELDDHDRRARAIGDVAELVRVREARWAR